jgi:hypothetical protein
MFTSITMTCLTIRTKQFLSSAVKEILLTAEPGQKIAITSS